MPRLQLASLYGTLDSNTMNPSPPIIGITARHRDKRDTYRIPANYLQALRAEGGVPILLTPGETQIEALLAALDGLVLSGGGDINPQVYGGDQTHPKIRYVCNERDEFELKLAQLALKADVPILGICRGMQILNVISGGTLYPHLPDTFGQVDHFKQDDLSQTRHTVKVIPNTHLADITQVTEFSVVSWHHQGVQAVPLGWRVAAYSDDDLIESIEHLTHPWALGIQWHPEFSALEPEHKRIFSAFMNAAKEHKAQQLLAYYPRVVGGSDG